MEVLSTVAAAEPQEQPQDLRSRGRKNYLRSTGEELNPEGIQRDFRRFWKIGGEGLGRLTRSPLAV